MFYHFQVATLVGLMKSYCFEVASVRGRGKVRIHKQTVHNKGVKVVFTREI